MDTAYEVCCGVLGNPSTGEFQLIDVTNGDGSCPLSDNEAAANRARGIYFIGSLGYVNAMIAVESDRPEDPQEAALMALACTEFSRYVADRMRPKDDGSGWCDWLKKLWSLPDTREN